MATTNAMIIELYKAEHNITMPLHTYAKWQSMGYQVKKGEKAQHRITIWKGCTKTKVNADGEEITTSKVIMKEACSLPLHRLNLLRIPKSKHCTLCLKNMGIG